MQTISAEHPWLLPAAILGVLGITLQGAKAAWDLYLGISAKQGSSNAARLQEATAAMSFIEGLPLDQTQKAVLKMDIVRLLQQKAEIEKVYEVVQRAIGLAGGSASN